MNSISKSNPLFSLLALLAGVCVLMAPSGVGAAAAPERQRTLLDADWRFQLGVDPVLTNRAEIMAWRWKVAEESAAVSPNVTAALDSPATEWQDAKTGDDVFKGRLGFAWFRTELPQESGQGLIVRFQGVDDNATVWLNGQRLIHHEGWNEQFDVPLDTAWKKDGANVLLVLVENTAGPGGITAGVALGRIKTQALAGNPADPRFNDARWRTVHLPHDYVVEGPFTNTAEAGHGSLLPSTAWYRKTFTLPSSLAGKSVWIDFDGVYRDSVVYLNGKELGEHPSGYTSFRYDISKAAKFGGQNTLAVHVDARHFEGWWYEGGGLYRHVWLNVANRLHVAPWGTFVTAELPEPGADGKA